MKALANRTYITLLNGLKDKIRNSRLKAALAVNSELLHIYWEIGYGIIAQQKQEGWGTKIIDQLASDLKFEFPDMKGFSVRNLKYMRAFAEAYPDFVIVQHPAAQLKKGKKQIIEFVQHPAAQITWTHNQVILDKIKNKHERLYYINECAKNGWSRNILAMQIESDLFKRKGSAITNFSNTLPDYDSDLAIETFKNPYNFDFLALAEEIKEKDIEQGLVQHLKKFMLELGKGFAYVGSQYNIRVEGDDYFLDLLFFNFNLNRFVVFELKVGEFKPEYAGKLNFYVNVINDEVKGKHHQPTIGILLCKTPNKTVVKFALQGIDQPIGVAEYQLQKALPSKFKNEIPSIEELETEIDKEYIELKSPSEKRIEALKNRMAKLKVEEPKQIKSTQILFEIIDQSLIRLYNAIIERMKQFSDLFVSEDYSWNGSPHRIKSINELATGWKDEGYLNSGNSFYFVYNLNGFKKASKEAFDIRFLLTFEKETYWYGFSLENQQPLIKKFYQEQLSIKDINKIVDNISEYLVDQIESRLKTSKLNRG